MFLSSVCFCERVDFPFCKSSLRAYLMKFVARFACHTSPLKDGQACVQRTLSGFAEDGQGFFNFLAGIRNHVLSWVFYCE